jgi:hypothetical protein
MKRLRKKSWLMPLWLVLACGLVPANSALSQGTIVYHRPTEPLFGLVGVELDLNGDGQPECRFFSASYFEASYYATAASGVGSARLLVTPQGPYDSGSYLVGWNAGYVIGGPTNEWLFWAAKDAPNAYGQATVLGAYIPEDVGGSLIGVGDFYGTTAFIGIHFQIGSEWHYGWVRIRGGTSGVIGDVFYLAPPGWILDWAYETRPNTPITAGQTKSPISFTANFTGANEVPRNNSTHVGHGSFTLDGNTLTCDARVDGLFIPTTADIYGPANPNTISRHLITNLTLYGVALTNIPPPFNMPDWWQQPTSYIGEYLYRGQVTLNQKQIAELLAGRWYVNFTSAAFRRGEIRGQIIPSETIQFVTKPTPRWPDTNSLNTSFTLAGDSLSYALAVSTNFPLQSVELVGPSKTRLVLDIAWGVFIPDGGFPGQPGLPGQILYAGTVNLTDRQVWQVKRGEWSLEISTNTVRRGKLRAQILATDGDQDGLPDFIESFMEQTSPCDAAWTNHTQYVRSMSCAAVQLAASRLITVRQYCNIVRRAQRSDCGKDQ